MSQKLVPNKVIVTLMTSAVVSHCKNRKIPHNKAPVSQLGSDVDGHPQESLRGCLPLFGPLFFPLSLPFSPTGFMKRLSLGSHGLLLYLVFDRLYSVAQDPPLSKLG